ncbi:MarR family winged helix-turn-helix transcriptional regulator [Salinactinospora qingdaonensis]|uniref:MarR family transcriptional regulator n=1 Tax=Salinactinospora qingdaonensis TaxID=702744 RepID=A0ABP7FPV5_9ACTN
MDSVDSVTWLTDDEQRIWRSYLNVNSMLAEILDRDLQRRHSLSLVEYGILVHLSEAEGARMRMRNLAETVIVSKSRLSHQIARLERDGYVRRENCQEDRRGAWAILTDQGEKALRESAPDHVALVRQHLFDRIGPERVQQLGEIMAQLELGLREAEQR